MKSSSPANRRDSERNQIDCMIRLQPVGNAAEPAVLSAPGGIVQDVSATGARIWAECPFKVGEWLRLSFGCVKAGLAQETACLVEVVWADPEPLEGRWQLGIRFQASDASHRIADALTRGCPWCEKLCPEIAIMPGETTR